ncbi:unnamed protein product [Caretta caretta]
MHHPRDPSFSPPNLYVAELDVRFKSAAQDAIFPNVPSRGKLAGGFILYPDERNKKRRKETKFKRGGN